MDKIRGMKILYVVVKDHPTKTGFGFRGAHVDRDVAYRKATRIKGYVMDVEFIPRKKKS